MLLLAKPLSIQAHLDKGLAELLHAMHPAMYRDANQKLEMAIAISDFRALFGFADIEVRSNCHCVRIVVASPVATP